MCLLAMTLSQRWSIRRPTDFSTRRGLLMMRSRHAVHPQQEVPEPRAAAQDEEGGGDDDDSDQDPGRFLAHEPGSPFSANGRSLIGEGLADREAAGPPGRIEAA